MLDAILDDRRVDPFKIWLDALPAWDGEDRIDFWLGHAATRVLNLVVRAMGHLIRAGVRRARAELEKQQRLPDR